MTLFFLGALTVVVLELAVLGAWLAVLMVRAIRLERQRRALELAAHFALATRGLRIPADDQTPPVLFPGSRTLN